MKKKIFLVILSVLIIAGLTACSTAEKDIVGTTESTVTTTVAAESVTENTTEKETTTSESTTKKSDDSDTTTKPAEQKSAGQTTTKKQSETNAKKGYSQTTASQNAETTKVAATTKKETTTQKPVTTTEKSFDVNYWVSYAKDYAKSVGLEVNSSASDCWDNPISANAKCKCLERDIKGMLNRYAKDEDITQVWIWAEKVSADSYNIYIGYA